ncbi:MAG: maltose alpha-D-glucosyltransferase, partial [Gemmatimonadota bacterium]
MKPETRNQLQPAAAEAADVDDPLWYRDAIIYELHVKAFYDANGDGIGDFRGLTEKLDYVAELGVNTIWLLPFYPSPFRDDGYDVADYHNVHPAYGTRQDFRTFVREAHKRNLRIITELVVNHTSDQHPWFQAARRAPRGSDKRNFYVWSDDPNKYAGTRIIFTDSEKSNWTWDEVAQQYYWHRFFSHQPDLNFDNPRVRQAVFRTMRFWLDMGVDGFRLDAIPYLVEREGTSNENLQETHAVIKEIRARLDARYRNRLLLAEANMWPEDVREYFGNGDECHMAYHFPLMPRMYMAIAQEDRSPIVEIMQQTPDIPDGCQWSIFLRNHDELTLEMVTSRERDYMYQMYADDRRARINLGIRRRLAPLMENDRDRIKLMNSLLLSMPGSPIIYYGDEIGMGDNIFLGDRDGVRTPMQWTGDRNGGFSRADPQRLYVPPIMDAVYGFEVINVESQSRTPASLLNWMRRMLAVRKSTRAFGRGRLVFLHPGNRKVLAYLREYEDEALLCVANLGRTAQPVELDLARHKGRVPIELMGRTTFPPIGELPYLLTLPGHGFYWFRL